MKISKLLSPLLLMGALSGSVSADQIPPQRPSDADIELKKLCENSVQSKKIEYDRLISERKYWRAAGVLRPCLPVWKSSEMTDLVARAEILEHRSIIKDPKASKEDKLRAKERLVTDYPELGKVYAKEVEKEDRAARSKQLSYMKGQGVAIGMNQDEVMASNWGRPKHINKTTTSYGTHEQWVYGGNNYLYFENGRLTAIQN